MALAFWVGVLMVSSLASLASGITPKEVHTHEEARFLMGTLARIQVSAPTKAEAAQCAAAGFRALDLADSVFSTWRPDSEISHINSQAGQGPVQISAAMAEVLSSALDFFRRSDGAFDPTVLPLVELWGFRDSQPGPPPSTQAVAQVLMAVGAQLVQLRTAPPTVELLHPETKLDLGALAKGAALDQAATAMMQCGALGGMLDLGGGLLLFGQTDVQLVGVVNPLDPDHPLDVIPLSKGSVATSGQYERFRESDDQTWGHILDPRTGQPCEQTLSVTVVTETALLADALATACFVLGPTEGLQLLESTPECEGLLMFESFGGEPVLLSTSHWPGNFTQITPTK
jgi:FAD:protein FMN transferase